MCSQAPPAPLPRIGAHTAKNSHRPGEPPRRERHHVHARRVDPLQVVDRHQQRPFVGEVFDYRQERRGHGALIGGRAVCPPASAPGRLRVAAGRANLPTRMRAPRPAGQPGPCRPARIRPQRRAPTAPETPSSRACSWAANHRVVLPMPVSPSISNADGSVAAEAKNPAMRPLCKSAVHAHSRHN